MDTNTESEVEAAPPVDVIESAEIERRACEPSISISSTSEEVEPVVEEPQAPPPEMLPD